MSDKQKLKCKCYICDKEAENMSIYCQSCINKIKSGELISVLIK